MVGRRIFFFAGDWRGRFWGGMEYGVRIKKLRAGLRGGLCPKEDESC